MARLNCCSRTRVGVMATHPRLQQVREGTATKKQYCAPKLLVPTTSHTAVLLPVPWGGDKALSFHRLPLLHHVLALLFPPWPGTS